MTHPFYHSDSDGFVETDPFCIPAVNADSDFNSEDDPGLVFADEDPLQDLRQQAGEQGLYLRVISDSRNDLESRAIAANDGQRLQVIFIDPLDYSECCIQTGSSLDDAVENFKSSHWEQGADADARLLSEYGDWKVYLKIGDTLLFQGEAKSLGKRWLSI